MLISSCPCVLTPLVTALTAHLALAPAPNTPPRDASGEMTVASALVDSRIDSLADSLTMDWVRQLVAAQHALAKVKSMRGSDTAQHSGQTPTAPVSPLARLKASPARLAVLKQIGITPERYVEGKTRLGGALVMQAYVESIQQGHPGAQVDFAQTGVSTRDVAFVAQHKAELTQLGYQMPTVRAQSPTQGTGSNDLDP